MGNPARHQADRLHFHGSVELFLYLLLVADILKKSEVISFVVVFKVVDVDLDRQ